MAHLHDLKPLFLDLSEPEQLEIISSIRASRYEPKKPHSKVAAKRREKKKSLNVKDLADNQLDLLIQQMERMMKGADDA